MPSTFASCGGRRRMMSVALARRSLDGVDRALVDERGNLQRQPEGGCPQPAELRAAM
jgi:hypothetical protein